jgi:ABC-2 type transport system permease protein
MIRYVLLLLGARLRLLYNNIRRGRFWAKIGWIVAALVFLGMGVASGFAGRGLASLLELLQQGEIQEVLREMGISLVALDPDVFLQSLLATLILAVWGIVLMSSLGAALSNFYLSSDLDLLMSAPIPMRAIFTAKLLEGLGLGYFLLFVLGGPALVGLGVGAGYSWPYFFAVFLTLLLVPLLPEALGTLLVMPLVRVIPPKRLREALQVLGGLIGASFYFFSQLSQGQDIDPQTAGRVIGWLYRMNLPFLPQAWAAHGLIALGGRRYLEGVLGIGAFSLLSIGLYVVCLILAERLYYVGWANLRAEPTTRSRRAQRVRSTRDLPVLPRQLYGILVKDLRLFLRDPQSWTSLLMPVAVYVLFLVQRLRQAFPEDGMPAIVFPIMGSGLVLFLGISMVGRLGLGGIGSERKRIWLLQCAPVSPRQILWAKFLAAYLPFLGLTGLMLVVFVLVTGAGWSLFLGNWLLVALLGIGVTGLSVGLGASFPRLEAEKPQQVVSTGAGCLYFPLIMIYAGLVAAVLMAPSLLSGLLTRNGLTVLKWVLWATGPSLAIVLTALALWVPLNVGAARLAKLEP